MKTKKWFSKSLLVLGMVSALVGSCLTPQTASADAPYRTYTLDGYGSINETQTAYMPYSSITKVGEEALNAPTDMMIKDDLIYIADTGNKRIIVSTLEGEYVREFGNGNLVYPSGVLSMYFSLSCLASSASVINSELIMTISYRVCNYLIF